MEMILGFHLYLSFQDSSLTPYRVILFQDWEHAAHRLEQAQSDMGDSFDKSRFPSLAIWIARLIVVSQYPSADHFLVMASCFFTQVRLQKILSCCQ